MIDISVVIVTWNSANEITRCLDSVINNSRTNKINVEAIVVDNDSKDGTYDILQNINNPSIHAYRNNTNSGYTKGTNNGIGLSKGKYIFLLNPDTELKKDCLKTLFTFLEQNPGYAAVAPLLLNEDGSIQYSIRNFPTFWSMYCEFTLLSFIFPKSRLFGNWKMKYFQYDKNSDVNQPMAAALMLRRDFLEKFGNMDERFVMFFNDVDICKRISDNGKTIHYMCSAAAIHKKGSSVYKDRIRMIRTWDKDCISYFRKYHNNPILIIWLSISLKISEIFRILYHKVTHK